MADGDYERGRDREIAALQSRLRALAKVRAVVSPPPVPEVLTLNGWAASPDAWSICAFASRKGTRLFSYIEQLDGMPERHLETASTGARFVIVGWSMGGSSALRLACRYPRRIAGLVLVAATPRMMEERDSAWRGMNARRLEALRKGVELTHGEGFFGQPEGRPNPYMADTDDHLARGLKYLLDTDLRAELEREFTGEGAPVFPVYVFQSEHDGIVRPENAAYLKRIFPHCRLTMIPGTEHALPVAIPKEIDNAVDACLAVAAQS